MKPKFKGSNSPYQVKIRPKMSKIYPKLAVNTITTYFKTSVPLKQELTPSPTTPPASKCSHLVCSRRSKSKSSNSHSSPSQESPVSRSPTRMSRKLTPVKLSAAFEFDFLKVTPVDKLTREGSDKFIRNSSTLTSTSIYPHSTISPQTPDTKLENQWDLFYSVKTPSLVSSRSSVSAKRFSHCKLSNSSRRQSSCLSDDEIVIVSDSSKSSCKDDNKSQRRRMTKCSRMKKERMTKFSRLKKEDIIRIDCSSDSDIAEIPPTKKTCHIDLTEVAENTAGEKENANTCLALAVKDETVEHNVKEPMTSFVPSTNIDISNREKGVSSQMPSSCGAELDGPSKERPFCTFQTEVKSLLQKRGVDSFCEDQSVKKVCLMNSVRNSVTESLLNTDCRFISDNLFSLTEYLRNVTSIRTMPLGKYLAQLIIIISNRQSLICNEVSAACLCYLNQLVLLHPPGQHPVVDSQYKSLFTTLQGVGESLWEFLDTLYRGSEYCIRLHSFLIDLFLLNYWSTLQNKCCQPPLFVDVFWTSKESRYLTTPITKLLERTCDTLSNFNSSQEDVTKLDNLTTLIYLCGTHCQYLSSQLLLACKKLSAAEIILLLGNLHSSSLYSHITGGLPDIEKMLRKSEQIFLAVIARCTTQSGEMDNEALPSGPSDILKESTTCSSQPYPTVTVAPTQTNSVQALLEESEPTKATPAAHNLLKLPMGITIRKNKQNVVKRPSTVIFNQIKRPCMTSIKARPSDILKESTTCSSQLCPTVAPTQTNLVQPLLKQSGVLKPSRAISTAHHSSKHPSAVTVRKNKQDVVKDTNRPWMTSTTSVPSAVTVRKNKQDVVKDTNRPWMTSTTSVSVINDSGSESYGKINGNTKVVKGTTSSFVCPKNIGVSQNSSVIGESKQLISKVNLPCKQPLNNALFNMIIASQNQPHVYSQDQLPGVVQNPDRRTHSKSNISTRPTMQEVDLYHKHITTTISNNALSKVCENCKKGTCLRCVKPKT